MRICVAGQGAFGQKHLDALKRIPGVELTSLVGGNQDATAKVAEKYGIPIHAIGIGEGAEDLRPFEARAYARSLVGLDA